MIDLARLFLAWLLLVLGRAYFRLAGRAAWPHPAQAVLALLVTLRRARPALAPAHSCARAYAAAARSLRHHATRAGGRVHPG